VNANEAVRKDDLIFFSCFFLRRAKEIRLRLRAAAARPSRHCDRPARSCGWGMASGGWLAGLLYDHYGFYAPAFAAGLAANAVNFSIVRMLALRRSRMAIA
jgi:hypothetical protein